MRDMQEGIQLVVGCWQCQQLPAMVQPCLRQSHGMTAPQRGRDILAAAAATLPMAGAGAAEQCRHTNSQGQRIDG